MSDVELFEDEAAISEFKSLMADPASRQAFVELKHRAAENGAQLKYAHVLRAVSETPWAIRLPMLGIIVDLLAYRAAGGTLTHDEIEARIGAARRQNTPSAGGVAVLPLHGVIMPKASMMSEMSGGTSIDRFRSEFRQAVAAPDVAAIVIDVDSPGGMVDGVPEMAAEIRSARGTKPIVAVANTEAASAAYWLASQADSIVVSKSGRVGSIGVYTSHEDESIRAEQQGVKTTLISAGKYKTEGSPFEPLSAEARANLQSMVDELYGMFIQDVAKGRGVSVNDVRTGYGEGRVVQARAALSGGMVDRIATLDEVIGDMLGKAQRSQAAAALDPALPAGHTRVERPTYQLTQSGTTTKPYVSVDWEIPTGSLSSNTVIDSNTTVDATQTNHDDDPWDPERAVTECTSAEDLRSIAACERTIGEDADPQHWAFPHHFPGRGPNAEGVREALSHLTQESNITSDEREKAQAHLDAHMREISPDAESAAREAVDLYLSDLDPDGERFRVRNAPAKHIVPSDLSEWDANKALNQCVTPDDYFSICAGHRDTGADDEREHWVLAHHYLGKAANLAGVRNALSRLPHVQSITDRDAAERHLNFHLRESSPSGDGLSSPDADVLAELRRLKSGEE